MRGDRGRRVLGTKHYMAAKTRLPAGGKVSALRDPPAPLSHTSHSAPHIQVILLPSELSRDSQHFCDAEVITSVIAGAITQGLRPPPPLLFSSLPPLAQDMGQNIHLRFFPKCRGSTYMNYLLKNTFKLPLLPCSAARNKMPLE